ncbi:hypothetical protein YB2330_001163 [Saitoella coloradoensis]
MSFGRTFKLASGAKIPAVGLGTWKSKSGEVQAAVRTALQTGYRHIDCAWIYGNEKEVGLGLNEGGIDRHDLWITSKLWNASHQPKDVRKAITETLSNLNVDYLDLYLMHWPIAFARTPDHANVPKDSNGKVLIDEHLTENHAETWQAMESLVKEGLVKNIGVSNFNIRRLRKLLSEATIKPVVNQVELHPYNPQDNLLRFAEQNGVHLTAYSPLGSTSSPLLKDDVLTSLAEKKSCTVAQILLSWSVQRGTSVIPKSVNAERIRSNFEQISLSQDEFDQINNISRGKQVRYVNPQGNWGLDPFEDEETNLLGGPFESQ